MIRIKMQSGLMIRGRDLDEAWGTFRAHFQQYVIGVEGASVPEGWSAADLRKAVQRRVLCSGKCEVDMCDGSVAVVEERGGRIE